MNRKYHAQNSVVETAIKLSKWTGGKYARGVESALIGKVGGKRMTLEIAGTLVIVSIVWNIYLLIKMCTLEDKVSYMKGQIETMKRSKEGR